MPEPLNNWLLRTLKKARSVCEDSDRRNFAERLLLVTVDRVHGLTVKGAHVAPVPEIERIQTDDAVVLSMGWLDPASSWHLYITVRRVRSEKPRVELDFYGNPDSYSAENPTDEEISKALSDYFQVWKTTGTWTPMVLCGARVGSDECGWIVCDKLRGHAGECFYVVGCGGPKGQP